MAADILTLLIRLNLAAGLAILCVLALRPPARRLFGAGPAYALWLAVPLASVAALAPPRSEAVLAPPGLPIDTVARMATEWALPSGPLAAAPATMNLALVLLTLWIAGGVIALGAVALLHRRSLARLGSLQATGDARLFRSDTTWSGPAVIGAFRPRIVLPADFDDRFTGPEQAVVLTHERIHLARADAAINAVVVLFQCLNWMNPLVHIGARLLRLDQEMACDAAVIDRHPDARRVYAGAMLKTQLAPLQSPLGCYWPAQGRNPLKERFAMLKTKSPGRRRRYLGGAAVSLMVAAIGYGAWASNDEVRVVTQDVVEATARPVEVRLAQIAAPALTERRLDAKAAKAAAAKARESLVERPLAETERMALDGARAGLVQAYERRQLGLISASELAAQAARLAVLERLLGQKPAAAAEALRLAEAELTDIRARYDVGAASRSDIGLASERLVRLELALGRKPTKADEALRLAAADIERAREAYNVGTATRADIGRAAERLTRLQRALAAPLTRESAEVEAARWELIQAQSEVDTGAVEAQWEIAKARAELATGR